MMGTLSRRKSIERVVRYKNLAPSGGKKGGIKKGGDLGRILIPLAMPDRKPL